MAAVFEVIPEIGLIPFCLNLMRNLDGLVFSHVNFSLGMYANLEVFLIRVFSYYLSSSYNVMHGKHLVIQPAYCFHLVQPMDMQRSGIK